MSLLTSFRAHEGGTAMPGPRRPEAAWTSTRERRSRSALAGLCLLGAAGALALSACGGAARAPSGRPAGAGTPASLRERVDGAQSPAGYVLKTISSQGGQGGQGSEGPPTATTVWTDPANGNAVLQRGSGPARMANWERNYYQDRVLHWAQTQVNYGTRTWWAADAHAGKPVAGPVPKGPVGGAYTPGAVVGEVLDKAPSQIVGYPVIGGRRTIELSAAVAGQRFDFWVDGGTYQVIRTEHDYPAAMRVPPVTSVFAWVRSSPALVKFIDDPAVPAGFTRVQAGQGYAPGQHQ